MNTEDHDANPQTVVIKDVSFTYKAQESGYAIEHISLEIPHGQFVVIMGPSGAGKSTLASCLNGLIPHFIQGTFTGEVLIHGQNTNQTPVNRMAKEVGLVFQDFEAPWE